MYTRTHNFLDTYVNAVGDYFRVIDNDDCGMFTEIYLQFLGPIEDKQAALDRTAMNDDCPF